MNCRECTAKGLLTGWWMVLQANFNNLAFFSSISPNYQRNKHQNQSQNLCISHSLPQIRFPQRGGTNKRGTYVMWPLWLNCAFPGKFPSFNYPYLNPTGLSAYSQGHSPQSLNCSVISFLSLILVLPVWFSFKQYLTPVWASLCCWETPEKVNNIFKDNRLHQFETRLRLFRPQTTNHLLYWIKLLSGRFFLCESTIYSDGNFGGNRLIDGSIIRQTQLPLLDQKRFGVAIINACQPLIQ